MLALLIISFVAFNAYVAGIVLKYGIPESISASWYLLPPKMQFLFTVATWAYAFPLIPAGIAYIGLSFFAGIAIMFVGAAPAYQGGGLEASVHKYGAISGVLLAIAVIIGLLIRFPHDATSYTIILLSLTILSALTLTVKWLRKKVVFWIEVLVYYATFGAYVVLYESLKIQI
jgi:hypothetical protein